MTQPAFRHGDVVEVRAPSQILATLDGRGELDALPFQPEMIPFIGRRFVVDGRAEKICDTIHYTGSRRLQDTVIIGDLRCDGSAHAGCEAECRVFWKEAWLRPVSPGDPAAPRPSQAELDALRARVAPHVTRQADVDGKPETLFSCQATELFRASKRLRVWDPRPYVREFTCGNVSFGKFLRVTARAAVKEPMRKLGLVPDVHVPGTRTSSVKDPPLDLQPGDWVEVKSRDEIAETLSPQGRNRGLWFDREMLPYCGGTYRVRRRIQRFINDQTGKMLEMKSDCVTLDGVVCSGDLSLRRWFCPRAIYPYWRESWLRRVEGKPAAADAPAMACSGAAEG
jgi:hypothetical protein